MLLDGILEHNRGFVRGRPACPLGAPESLKLAVIACYDPRLNELLPAALGLVREKSFFLRAAGTVVRPEGDPLRSLALAVYLFGIDEVLVVGHTSCRMAEFASAPFIDAFRARGVTREAFGPRDLREWVGAIPDPRRGVQTSVAAITSAPFLPKDLTVAGLVLDDSTGALEVVVPATSVGTGQEAQASAPSTPSPEQTPSAQGAPEPPEAKAAPEVLREIDLVRSFVGVLETSAEWRGDLARLRQEVERQHSPMARLALIEKFLARSAVNARGVAAAFGRLKKEAGTAAIDLFRGAPGEAEDMSIGVVYLGLLGLGVVYALVSGALGWVSDLGGGDVHVDASGHLDAGHAHPISGTIVATFVTGFGAGGTVAHYLFEWRLVGSLSVATASGVALAAAAFGVLELIFKQTQAGSEFTLEEIVGREAEVITSIPAGGAGEVAYVVKGQREVGAARSVDGAAIPKGRLVLVEKVSGPTLFVRSAR